MIVVKVWTTSKQGEWKIEGHTYIYCRKKYRGWFLFGIIPLYIVNYETTTHGAIN